MKRQTVCGDKSSAQINASLLAAAFVVRLQFDLSLLRATKVRLLHYFAQLTKNEPKFEVGFFLLLFSVRLFILAFACFARRKQARLRACVCESFICAQLFYRCKNNCFWPFSVARLMSFACAPIFNWSLI